LRELFHLCRQTIMRVGQNKNTEFCHRGTRAHELMLQPVASGIGVKG
jgi:hypothetical protein